MFDYPGKAGGDGLLDASREDPDRYAYGRVLVDAGGRLAGAVLLNLPREAPTILAAARDRTPLVCCGT